MSEARFQVTQAAKRYAAHAYPKHDDGILTTSGNLVRECDMQKIADWAIKELAARREAERERGKLVGDLLDIVVDAISHGMPITKHVADARNRAVQFLAALGLNTTTSEARDA